MCNELDDERHKHAQDTAQGDDVTYMLEKERERLKQEVSAEANFAIISRFVFLYEKILLWEPCLETLGNRFFLFFVLPIFFCNKLGSEDEIKIKIKFI